MKEKMKNTLRKLLSIFAVLAMVLGMVGGNAIPAMAANDDGTITINNPIANELYDVYKVFDAVPDNAENPTSISYTYTSKGPNDAFLTALQGNDSPFTVTQVGTTNQYNVVWKTVENQTEAQKQTAITTFFNNQKDNLGDPVRKIEPVKDASTTAEAGYTAQVITAASGETPAHITLTDLEYGYYFITTTTGSAVLINSAAKNATINEKNTVPSIDKKQSVEKNNDAINYTDDAVHANIGDTIYYQIQVTVGANNNSDYNITDTLSAGLSLNVDTSEGSAHETIVDGTVKIGENPLPTDKYHWSLVPDGTTRIQGFTLIINKDYLNTLTAGTVITIQYSARLNPNAVINNMDDKNTNEVKLEYSHQTVIDKTEAYTYDFNLKKSDAANADTYIAGAEFKLYDAEKGGTQIKVAHDSTGYYVNTSEDLNADTTVISVDNAKGVNVRGLKPGTYWLEETKAPAGYDRKTSRQSVTIATNQTGSAEINVTNTKGSVLPSTGGIGTTIFYVIGGVVVAGAIVLLIARRRKNA